MRLFIAINFSAEIKDKLQNVQNALKEHTLNGKYTTADNLHLTLVFLGEVADARVRVLRQVMDGVTVAPFELRMSGVGRFKRDGGDIWWMGVDLSESLQALYEQLYEGVTQNGFSVEKRRFTPHLTLAREVNMECGFDTSALSVQTQTFGVAADKISLMKSERIHKKLTYTEIYAKTL